MKTNNALVLKSARLLHTAALALQSTLLLLLRVFFFWQLLLAGWGKLANPGRTAEFFAGLGIPFPLLNVYLAGGTEFLGGCLLVIGLGSRLAAVPVAFTMLVAYLTAEREAFLGILQNPDAFVGAAPFPFLLTALIVLAFGPGVASLDHLIRRRLVQAFPGWASSQ